MLVGDSSQDWDGATVITPWAMEMTLWDTVTNEMTLIPHPPGIDTNHDDGGVHDDMRFVLCTYSHPSFLEGVKSKFDELRRFF